MEQELLSFKGVCDNIYLKEQQKTFLGELIAITTSEDIKRVCERDIKQIDEELTDLKELVSIREESLREYDDFKENEVEEFSAIDYK